MAEGNYTFRLKMGASGQVTTEARPADRWREGRPGSLPARGGALVIFAEEKGFEPLVAFRPRRFSKPARPPLALSLSYPCFPPVNQAQNTAWTQAWAPLTGEQERDSAGHKTTPRNPHRVNGV